MINDNKHLLLVGSYAPKDKPGIYAFTFDSATGEMVSQGAFTGITNPSFLTVHPNNKWLYAVSETGQDSDGIEGSVWSFSIQHEPMKLQPINQHSTNGDWPCHVQIDVSGRWLIASNYGTGNAALFPILSNGALGEMKAFVQHEGYGPNISRQEGPHAHSATFTPDNRYVIVADLGIDQLVIYKFDADNGALLRHGETQTLPGAGPRHLAFHPNGQHVLVANELDSSVSVYAYDARPGTLHAEQTISTLPSDAPENTAADIHFLPSGQHVYVSNRGHDSLAIFAVDEDPERLTAVTYQATYGKTPRNFAIDPSGAFLLTANQDTNNIVTFRINQTTGHLNYVGQKSDIPKPVCLKMVILN